VGLKLHYDERVFDLKWTGFALGFTGSEDSSRSIKGVVGTNQNIYFVDDKLLALGLYRWTCAQSITSLQWMGDSTVLVTTPSHLMHVYCEKHPKVDILLSLTECLERATSSTTEESDLPAIPVAVKGLADRVIFAS